MFINIISYLRYQIDIFFIHSLYEFPGVMTHAFYKITMHPPAQGQNMLYHPTLVVLNVDLNRFCS